MEPEPDAFLETIKNFASSDFCDSSHPEVLYWKYILDDAAWRGQRPNYRMERRLEQDSGRKRLCSPVLDVTPNMLTQQNNLDILPPGVYDHSEQEVEDRISREMPLEGHFGMNHDYSSTFGPIAESLAHQDNLDVLPAPLCGNESDHSEEDDEQPISTMSPSAVSRKCVNLAFEDHSNSSTIHHSNKRYHNNARMARSRGYPDDTAATGTPVETTYTGLAAGTHGENRLRIHFESFRAQGKYPQRFGKSGFLIPDGLRGTHEFYDQRWRFEISHGYDGLTRVEDYLASVQITWKITNLTSGLVVQVTETPQQAILREYSGRTVCNKVVKMAFIARAEELKRFYEQESDTLEEAMRVSLENNIEVLLRPRVCTVGLLFFGLLHDTVQRNLQH